MSLVADIANQSLDAIGWGTSIGDIQEGTKEAQILLRAYSQCRKQLLRGAHWDFARKTAQMNLLADATGQTANVGAVVPTPWIYAYSYPTDCLKARFIPWNPQITPAQPPGNIQTSTAPVVTGLVQGPLVGQRIKPARFTVATDPNFTSQPGANGWEIPGVSPQGSTVVLTNVQTATLVYTMDMLYPNMWDPQFRAALVAYIGSEVALPLWAQKDVKVGMAMRTQQVMIVKDKLKAARVSDGNEGWYSSDIRVDWMAIRNTGGGWGGGDNAYGGMGVYGYGWDSCGFSDGSAY